MNGKKLDLSFRLPLYLNISLVITDNYQLPTWADLMELSWEIFHQVIFTINRNKMDPAQLGKPGNFPGFHGIDKFVIDTLLGLFNIFAYIIENWERVKFIVIISQKGDNLQLFVIKSIYTHLFGDLPGYFEVPVILINEKSFVIQNNFFTANSNFIHRCSSSYNCIIQ